MTRTPRLCLASASPRRRALLEQIGVPHSVCPADLDERVAAGESTADYVQRIARDKALAAARRVDAFAVLGADTSVVLEGEVFGKPADREDALRMLTALSGRTHQVLTAVALLSARDRPAAQALSVSQVRFRALGRAEIEAYWDTGEPRDKAGAYAVQGLGAVFVAELQGSYSGVMGLPLFETAQLLRAAGIECWQPFR